MRMLWCAALACLWLSSVYSEDGPDKNLIVHEWGTFTGIAGSDGVPLPFYSTPQDLPAFVYSNAYGRKSSIYSTVSLETPVTYFYARKAMEVSVKAEFPNGHFTDWYPTAKNSYESDLAVINWPAVKVLPGQTAELIKVGEPDRYFRARAADANLLQVNEGEKTERETFLFYRGTGTMVLPVRAEVSSEGKVKVTNQGSQKIAAAYLVTVNGKILRFKACSGLEPKESKRIDLKSTKEGVETLSEALVKTLVSQRLYEKEARAMVATWRDAWLEEEGTRVLYIMPTKATGTFLPLTVTPTPDETVRLMVGRQDLFTPKQEAEFVRLYADMNKGTQEAREKAAKAVFDLGRFRAAAVERAKALSSHQP